MGSITSKQHPQSTIFDIEQFCIIQPNVYTHRSSYGSFTSLRHRTTDQQIDRYFLEFSSKKQLNNYRQCFMQRFREQYIVNTIQFVDKTQRQFCGNLYTAQVYIENIPVRLRDITDIPYPDNLYILKNSLIGFELLFNMIGYFSVEQDHICINNYGEAKVWLNSDLSKNYPQDYKERTRSQCEMVLKIVSLIEQNTSIQQCPIQISEYFERKNKKTPKFKDALELLQQYIGQYKVVMPKYCESIFQLFKQEQRNQSLLQSQDPTQTQNENQNEEENRGSIIINQTIVPVLNIPDRGQQYTSQENNVETQDQKMKKKTRQTIKFQVNMSNMYRCYESQRNRQGIVYSQNTERHAHNTERINKSLVPIQLMVENYNRLQTKRTPVYLKERFGQFSEREIIVKAEERRPKVFFNYLSPIQNTMHWNRVICYNNQSLNYENSIEGRQNREVRQKKINIQGQKDQVHGVDLKQINFVSLKNDRKEYSKETRVIQKERKWNGENNINIGSINQKKKEKVRIYYFDTGTKEEEIDPEIAADLLKYL